MSRHDLQERARAARAAGGYGGGPYPLALRTFCEAAKRLRGSAGFGFVFSPCARGARSASRPLGTKVEGGASACARCTSSSSSTDRGATDSTTARRAAS